MSAYEQFEREHAFIDKENIKKYGRDIIKLYFKNISMRQCINKSYEDSEKDGFIHQNTNTVKSKIKKIDTIFADVNNPSPVIEDNENNECEIGDRVRVMETRPLSKSKRFRLVEIVEKVK